MTDRVRVGVSACLLGRQVRYDGDHKRDDWVVEELARLVELVPVCPEVEIGLGVPRDPIRLVKGKGKGKGEGMQRTTLIAPRTGRDLTIEMTAWANRRVDALAAEDLSGFVLKAASPSCGPAGVKLFASAGAEAPASLDGVGLFAAALRRRFPDMPIRDEIDLADRAQRQIFVDEILVYKRKMRSLTERMLRIAKLE